jgi:hypothetical protein
MTLLPKLVANWKSAWRWWSIRFSALAVAAETAWATVPPEVLAEFIEPTTERKITAGLILLAMLGRVIDQGTGSVVRK